MQVCPGRCPVPSTAQHPCTMPGQRLEPWVTQGSACAVQRTTPGALRWKSARAGALGIGDAEAGGAVPEPQGARVPLRGRRGRAGAAGRAGRRRARAARGRARAGRGPPCAGGGRGAPCRRPGWAIRTCEAAQQMSRSRRVLCQTLALIEGAWSVHQRESEGSGNCDKGLRPVCAVPAAAALRPYAGGRAPPSGRRAAEAARVLQHPGTRAAAAHTCACRELARSPARRKGRVRAGACRGAGGAAGGGDRGRGRAGRAPAGGRCRAPAGRRRRRGARGRRGAARGHGPCAARRMAGAPCPGRRWPPGPSARTGTVRSKLADRAREQIEGAPWLPRSWQQRRGGAVARQKFIDATAAQLNPASRATACSAPALCVDMSSA